MKSRLFNSIAVLGLAISSVCALPVFAATPESTSAAEQLLSGAAYAEMIEQYVVHSLPHNEKMDEFLAALRVAVIENIADEFTAEEIARVGELVTLVKSGAPEADLKPFNDIGMRLRRVVVRVQAEMTIWALDNNLLGAPAKA